MKISSFNMRNVKKILKIRPIRELVSIGKEKAGFTLTSSGKFALVVSYCIENHIYNIQKLNDLLEERNLPVI